MDNFLRIFQTTWETDIKSIFERGLISYERQLQTVLYSQLRNKLTSEYEIYTEPVIYQLDKIKPDLVITKNEKIISVIELKCQPWGWPDFGADMKKLERFRNDLTNQSIVLGWVPKSVNWFDQDKQENLKRSYTVDKDLKLVIAIMAKYDSDIITKEVREYGNIINVNTFKIFVGYINNSEKAEFKLKLI